MANLSQTLQFAQEEISHFLPSLGSKVQLRVSPALPSGSFSGFKEQDTAVLSGADERCVLHAVYTFLEQMGWRFEITGPIKIGEADLAAFQPFSITPAVRWRGIRQHVNFPMDISGYRLQEAQEYIRNLARMRFNHITFHSYPNQWIDGDQDGILETAGHFFYGQRHDIPDHPLLKKVIANKKTFCIPEIEPYFGDVPKRSEMAIAWMQALMTEARRCGLRIQFSFEPRKGSLELTLKTCRHILEIYPLIDILELISTETSAWGEGCDEEPVRQVLAAHYSEEMLNTHEFRSAMDPIKESFADIMRQLAHINTAVQTFQPEAAAKQVQVALGIYCVTPQYHPAIFRAVRECVPQAIPFTILAEHSSGRVANALTQIIQDDADWQRTFVYSWVEFDGLMYLQQNGVPGIERLISQLHGKVGGMAFNHWRTAENQLLARYAAESCLIGSMPATRFYEDYARALGIGEPGTFARAHELIAEADWMATNHLPNIGFCYYKCWVIQGGMGYFENWQISGIEENHGLFEQAHRLLGQCARQTVSEVGREFLGFLDNRVRCTMVYLKAMAKGSELQAFKGLKPDQLDDEQKRELANICDQAIALLEQYMSLHAEAMPDRGCEGTLISLYHTPPAVLKRIRQDYAGIPCDQPPAETGHDEPPSPMEW